MTPSFRGRIALMLPGVRPSIFFASAPTATTRRPPRDSSCTATTEGSLQTIPSPFTYMRVFAVPRSIARSFEKSPRMESRIIARRPALLPPAPTGRRSKVLAERSARGNGNLSAAAGLQSRRRFVSLARRPGNAPLFAQVLQLVRHQDPLQRPRPPLRRVGGGRGAGRARRRG